MKNSHYARLLVVVEQSRNFNYSESPRLTTSLDLARCLPSVRSRTKTLNAIQREVTCQLTGYLPNKSSRLLVWLLDDDGKPVLFVTGLLDVREGKLNHKQLADWSEMLIPQVMCEQSMSGVSITVSATAEFTFCEDYDFSTKNYGFETEAYKGEHDFRDNCIAHDLVDEACLSVDESYVSYVKRWENNLLVNADLTTTVTIQVPWNHANQLRTDQLKYLGMEAEYALAQDVTAEAVRFVDIKVEPILESEPLVV